MKALKTLVIAVGCCWGADAYTAVVVSEGIRESDSYAQKSKYNLRPMWGTNTVDGKNSRQLVRYTSKAATPVTTGSAQAIYPQIKSVITPLLNTYIPNLKPKGSVAVFGANSGYFDQIWELPDQSFLFSTENPVTHSNYLFKTTSTGQVGNNAPNYDNKQAVLNLGEHVNGVVQPNIYALDNRSVLVATINKKTVLFYGEYNVSTNDQVALWKSTNMGFSWVKVTEWNTLGHQTRHIHGVVQNPYNNWIYILFGDNNEESGIVAWDGVSKAPPSNTPINKIGTYPGWKSIAGSAAVSTGDLLFTPGPNGKCVWIPTVDTLEPGKKLYSYRANYNLTKVEKTGQVRFMDNIPPIMGARSAYTGNLYWTSYRNANAAENKLHIWKSIDAGLTWKLTKKINIYTPWTSVPQNFKVINGSGSFDNLQLTARGIRFSDKMPYTGNTITTVSKNIR